MDLRDLASRRPPVNKTALRGRVRQIVAQKKSQNVAKNLVAGLTKTCRAVKKNIAAEETVSVPDPQILEQ